MLRNSDVKKSVVVMLCSIVLLVIASVPCYSENDLLLKLDAAQFRNADNESYLEIYYSLPEVAVTYIEDSESGYKYSILMSLEVYMEDSLWASKLWKLENVVPDISDIATTEKDKSKQIVDIIRYSIDKPGKYTIKLYARDMNEADKKDSTSIEIKLHDYAQKDLKISDLVLSSNIQPAQQNGQQKFIKYGYEIIPNPSKFYGLGSTNLFYFFEAYNLLEFVEGTKYKTLTKIKDKNGEIVPDIVRPYRTKNKRFDSSVEFGMINVSKLHSGIYSLNYGIADSEENVIAELEKEFYVYNPSFDSESRGGENILAADQAQIMEILTPKSEVELDDEFNKMHYLVDKEVRNIYNNLTTVEEKRKYINAIWTSIQLPETATAAFYRQRYLDLMEEANQKFSTSFREGWRTDKGRVYIVYGRPTNIELHRSSADSKPYEIWSYENIQGGVIFVFADMRGLNNYALIHSTCRGELYEPNWENLISSKRGFGTNY